MRRRFLLGGRTIAPGYRKWARQINRRLVNRGEQVGKAPVIGVGEGIFGASAEKGHLAIVRIDDHLHRMPEVIEILDRG